MRRLHFFRMEIYVDNKCKNYICVLNDNYIAAIVILYSSRYRPFVSTHIIRYVYIRARGATCNTRASSVTDVKPARLYIGGRNIASIRYVTEWSSDSEYGRADAFCRLIEIQWGSHRT